MKKAGFTLAELLITFVVVGIIAVMTIPLLITRTNEQETVVTVKKAYSILSQAYEKIITDESTIVPSELGNNETEATENFGKIFAKHLNVIQNCGTSANSKCFANETYKYLNGSEWGNLSSFTEYKLRLNDGMSLYFHVYNTYNSWGESPMLKNAYGFINIDTNGDKKPNTLGKDVFTFYITKDLIVPAGTPEETNVHSLDTCKIYGSGCTTWVLAKGNMDYLRKNVSW